MSLIKIILLKGWKRNRRFYGIGLASFSTLPCEAIYIPKQKGTYQKWGSLSGGRKKIDERNNCIKNEFYNGKSISQLAQEYFLSTETI